MPGSIGTRADMIASIEGVKSFVQHIRKPDLP